MEILLSMPMPAQFEGRLTLPLIAAPMFIVSGVELVLAACRAGVIGTFPSLNCRTAEDLDARLAHLDSVLAAEAAAGRNTAPYGVNLICHRTNQRLAADTGLVVRHRVPVVITSGGNPGSIVEQVHEYGGVVLSDVTDARWARKAAAAGVDGLILVCAGAGGHAGTMSPFALLPEVRAFFPGTIVLAGAISDGRAIRAAEVLGADMAYMGTRFIATEEANADARYRGMLVDCDADDLIYTDVFSGIPANMLRPSIRQFGLDPDNLPAKNALDISKELNVDVKAWRDIWTAGQGIASIHDTPPVATLVSRLRAEYAEASKPPGVRHSSGAPARSAGS